MGAVYQEIFDYTVAKASFGEKGDKLVLTAEEFEGVERVANAYAQIAVDVVQKYVIKDQKSPRPLAELNDRFMAAAAHFAQETGQLNMCPEDQLICVAVMKHFAEWCEERRLEIQHSPHAQLAQPVSRVH